MTSVALVVIDHDGYLAGIITRSDVVRGYLANDDWQSAASRAVT